MNIFKFLERYLCLKHGAKLKNPIIIHGIDTAHTANCVFVSYEYHGEKRQELILLIDLILYISNEKTLS